MRHNRRGAANHVPQYHLFQRVYHQCQTSIVLLACEDVLSAIDVGQIRVSGRGANLKALKDGVQSEVDDSAAIFES